MMCAGSEGEARPTPWGSACAARRDFAMIASLDATLGGVSDPFVVAVAWRDLSLDDVFAKLDRCVSMVGQQTPTGGCGRPSDSAADVARFDRKIPSVRRPIRGSAQFQEAVRRVGDALLFYGEPPPLPARSVPFATCVVLAAAVSVSSGRWPCSSSSGSSSATSPFACICIT